MDDTEIRDNLETAMCSMHRLNQWEQDFIESINDQFTNRGTLTEAQMAKLESIVNDKC